MNTETDMIVDMDMELTLEEWKDKNKNIITSVATYV